MSRHSLITEPLTQDGFKQTYFPSPASEVRPVPLCPSTQRLDFAGPICMRDSTRFELCYCRITFRHVYTGDVFRKAKIMLYPLDKTELYIQAKKIIKMLGIVVKFYAFLFLLEKRKKKSMSKETKISVQQALPMATASSPQQLAAAAAIRAKPLAPPVYLGIQCILYKPGRLQREMDYRHVAWEQTSPHSPPLNHFSVNN